MLRHFKNLKSWSRPKHRNLIRQCLLATLMNTYFASSDKPLYHVIFACHILLRCYKMLKEDRTMKKQLEEAFDHVLREVILYALRRSKEFSISSECRKNSCYPTTFRCRRGCYNTRSSEASFKDLGFRLHMKIEPRVISIMHRHSSTATQARPRNNRLFAMNVNEHEAVRKNGTELPRITSFVF